ncbi:MAG: cation transporting ATPase C-terminal domain-containing protein [Candidatus Thiodiazotropha endolucinida]
MIIAVTLALALEPPEVNVMCRSPIDSDAPLLTAHQWWRIAFVSTISTIDTIGLLR